MALIADFLPAGDGPFPGDGDPFLGDGDMVDVCRSDSCLAGIAVPCCADPCLVVPWLVRAVPVAPDSSDIAFAPCLVRVGPIVPDSSGLLPVFVGIVICSPCGHMIADSWILL